MPDRPAVVGSVPGSLPQPSEENKHDGVLAEIPLEEINTQVEPLVNRQSQNRAREQEDIQANRLQVQVEDRPENQNIGLTSDANRNNSQNQNLQQLNRIPQNNNTVPQRDEFGNILGILRDQEGTSNRNRGLQNISQTGASTVLGRGNGERNVHGESVTANVSGVQQGFSHLGHNENYGQQHSGYGASTRNQQTMRDHPYGYSDITGLSGFGGPYNQQRMHHQVPAGFSQQPNYQQQAVSQIHRGINPVGLNDDSSLADLLSNRRKPSASANPFIQISPEHYIQQQPQTYPNIPTRPDSYEYPSQKNSDFVSAMSQIARNSAFAATGIGQNNLELERELSDQIKMELALKMGLNGPQQLNKRALCNVLSSHASRSDMKQILQARAELYNESVSPKFFTRSADLAAKSNTEEARSSARSLLAAAPLTVIQLDARDLRDQMTRGDTSILNTLKLGTRGTTAQFLKALGKAPLMDIIRLLDASKADYISSSFLRQAEDLDFVQEVLTATGKHKALNPLLNAVLDAFSRRRRSGGFKDGPHSLEMD